MWFLKLKPKIDIKGERKRLLSRHLKRMKKLLRRNK